MNCSHRRIGNALVGAVLLGTVIVTGSGGTVYGQISPGPDGHLIRYGGRVLLLVGDSGTQCVMQNLNIDYRHWIDDCAEAGLNAIHVWSFVAPRQTRDGRVIERRYGYLYPGVTPWARRSGGPTAHDGWQQWDLRRFDEGDDPRKHYWPRMRDLCRYAKQKGLLVGITVFFGWPKHNTADRPDWSYHPFNILNGGHLTDHRPIVQAVQQIATPGREILELPWSDSWNAAMKTQWLWERFAAKLLAETQPFGNTFYVFMDERSYPEGNCGDHFATFFRRRNAFWIDGQLRQDKVDGIVDGHGARRNINQIASDARLRDPPRPLFEFELPPYRGDAVRHNLYGCLLAGGHYFFHDDERQETPTTGIMSYDPNVRGSRRQAVRERLRWLGIACKFMNEQVQQLRAMEPHNEVIRQAAGYCSARPGEEYVVYVKHGGRVTLWLEHPADAFRVKLVSPRTGKTHRAASTVSGNNLNLQLPDTADWLIHLVRKAN